jgi:hypothetical protein
MRNHRLVTPLSAAAIATAAGLAVASPAEAEDEIGLLHKGPSGQQVQPISALMPAVRPKTEPPIRQWTCNRISNEKLHVAEYQ